MKLVLADLRKLQPSVLLTALMSAAGAALVLVSQHSADSAERARLAAIADRNSADGKLKRVRDEENEIKQKSVIFARLQERGVIGDEQRLEWVELLKDIRDQRRLLDLQYELAPQRLLDGKPGGDLVFSASAMKLQFKLLHEEDLTRLLGDLDRQAKALIQVKACKVERLPASNDERGSPGANLQAECEIDWLTLRQVSAKQERGS